MKMWSIVLCAICVIIFMNDQSDAWPVSNPEMLNVRNLITKKKKVFFFKLKIIFQ